MKISDFRRGGTISSTLEDFFSGPGRAYLSMEVSDFCEPEAYRQFKASIANYALGLSGRERLDLYQRVHDLAGGITKTGKGRVRYELKDSFIGEDEANLIIMKLLHGGMTQHGLAQELRCSRQTIDTRMANLRCGVTLGDMSVQICAKYGGLLESTVHPVLLPLSLSEIYLLLSCLGSAAKEGDTRDPHAATAYELGQKIYFQLTDYARERVDGRLSEAGIDYRGGIRPTFVEIAEGDLRHSSTRYDSRDRWLFLEKSEALVKVTCAGGVGAPYTITGRLRPSEDPAGHPELLAGRNPAHCFCLLQENGDIEVLSWADVIDIDKA